MCDFIHSCVWLDSVRSSHCDMCDMSHAYMWHDVLVYVAWLSHICDTTHSYMWHDSLMCVPSLIPKCDVPQLYVRHDSFLCVTCLNSMRDITHFYVWHNSYLPAAEPLHDVWHMTHVTCHTPHLPPPTETHERDTWHRPLTESPHKHTLSVTQHDTRQIDWFWKSGWLIHKSTLCTRIVPLPVRSQNDLKVPRKLIDVMKISISTENRMSKSVYNQHVTRHTPHLHPQKKICQRDTWHRHFTESPHTRTFLVYIAWHTSNNKQVACHTPHLPPPTETHKKDTWHRPLTESPHRHKFPVYTAWHIYITNTSHVTHHTYI